MVVPNDRVGEQVVGVFCLSKKRQTKPLLGMPIVYALVDRIICIIPCLTCTSGAEIRPVIAIICIRRVANRSLANLHVMAELV